MLPPYIMKLYYYPLCAASRAVLILCKQENIPYDPQLVLRCPFCEVHRLIRYIVGGRGQRGTQES